MLYSFNIKYIRILGNCEDILKDGDIIEIKEGELPKPPKPLTYRIVNGNEIRPTDETLEEMARQARLHAYHKCLGEHNKDDDE